LILTLACAVLLLIAAGFHFHWALGGDVGRAVAIPQLENGEPLMQVPVAGSAMVGLFLLACACLALAMEFHRVPQPVAGWAAITLAMLFAARGLSFHRYVGLFKRVRDTPFGRLDTLFYSPACLLFAAAFARLGLATTGI